MNGSRSGRGTAAAAGALAAVVVVVSVVVAAARLDGRDATVHADGGPRGEAVAIGATTGAQAPAEGSVPTTAPPSEEAGQPIAEPAPTTTTTTVPAPGACPVEAIELRVTSDRPSYRPGERVIIHADGTNRSDHDCAPLESWETQIRHEGSDYGYGAATMAARTEAAVWRAGETQRVTLEWDQQAFDGEREQPAPPGSYAVTATWGVRDGDRDRRVSYTGSTTFEIREA